MCKRLLLLGSTGKIGTALSRVLADEFEIIGKNSRDFNAADFGAVRKLINDNPADIVINTVAFLGVGPCEKDPQKAFLFNTLFPKLLAEISREKDFLLIHFSTDAVFNDEKKDFYTESDQAYPLNIYGITKLGGDCFIKAIAKKFYIFRFSVLFGETTKNTQFVEKMLEVAKKGTKLLKISNDIISSPTYSKDAAKEIKRIVENRYTYGIYHIANEGTATLYELMNEIVKHLDLKVKVEPASYKDFPYLGIKNTCTPIKSCKVKSLRHWKEAVKEYCECINNCS